MLYRDVQLLGTEGCHLCVVALDVLGRFNDTMSAHDFQLRIEEIDIASDSGEGQDSKLVEEYGVRIPVLIDISTRHELNWPFDEKDVYSFLRACSLDNEEQS